MTRQLELRTAGRGPDAAGPDARRPLVVTADDGLLDEMLRLSAVGGMEVDVAADPQAARGRFTAAPMVMIGADQAAACLRSRLPRRADVIVVCHADAPPELWDTAEALGAAHVVILPAGQSWLVDRLAGGGRGEPPAPVVAVVGGRGGAGASVLAAGLAVTAVNASHRALLVDADPLGGGLDLVLGWEDDNGVRWPELTGTSGRLDAPALIGALPGRGDLALLSFDRRELPSAPPAAMTAVLSAGRHARDLVVVDLPRHFDPAAVVALEAADQCLLVVPAELRAATAAARVAAAATAHCAQVRLVVRGPSPGRLSAEQISESLGLPLAGSLRPEAGLAATLEGGLAPTTTGRGPLAMLCRRLITELCQPMAVAA